jgi:hypothetical protein
LPSISKPIKTPQNEPIEQTKRNQQSIETDILPISEQIAELEVVYDQNADIC